MENHLKQVNVKVFRADKNREDCLRFVEGHHKVLESYGVTQVTSANVDWMTEPYSYVIFVEDGETGKALGGGRIQLDGGEALLPIAKAIDKLDPRIYDLIKQKSVYRTGEFCGLWNSKEVAGYGIGSIILGRVGVTITGMLNMGSLFALASPATLRNCQRVGFKVIRKLGINGIFYYPKEDLIATALIIEDPRELSGAKAEEREKILAFRKNPVQNTLEHGPRGEIEVNYDLRIPKEDIIKIPDETSQVGI